MSNLEDLLEWNDGTQEYERRFLQKVSKYEIIVIFGAGIGGKMTLDLLEKYGLKQRVNAFSDNNADKIGTIYYGIPVVKPETIKDYSDKAVILISSTAFNAILNQLMNLGISKENIYYFQPAGMSLENHNDIQFIREHIVEFSTVYNLLVDDTSKLIYSSLINYRISKNEVWLEKMKPVMCDESEQYFDRELLISYDFKEGFIDGGGIMAIQ